MRTQLPKELIEDYQKGAKIISLSKKYDVEYNVLYFKIGRLGMRRKEKKGGYRGGYRKNCGRKKIPKNEIREKSSEFKERQKYNTLINDRYFAKQPKGMKANLKYNMMGKYDNDYYMD